MKKVRYKCIQKMENDPKRNSGGPVKIFTIRKCRFWINVTMRTIDTP